MVKTRVGVILRESVGSKSTTNQSADLKALHDKYIVFVKHVRALSGSLQQHLGALQQLEKTRSMLSKNFASFSKNTPLWDACGQMPDADHPADSVCSYASVYDTLSAKNKSFASKYQQFVVSYVVEWEKTVTTRVSNGLKKVEDQRRELNHYQKKVEALRLTTNKIMASGKQVKADSAEKLKRNEEKLVAAKQLYNKMSSQLCILMEEVSERSWRDLHPLLVKVVQFDMTMSADEAKVLAAFSQVVTKLKAVANSNGIAAQPRINDLGTLNPELLSTRPGGPLSIEASATSPLSATSASSPLFGSASSPTNFGDMALPPGTVGAQGMGGFPVRVASSGSLPGPPQDSSAAMSRASSFSSYGSGFGTTPALPPAGAAPEPPSTLSMLSISQAAAPAPTLDDVYNNNNSFSGVRSAPPSGNLPPLAPAATAMNNYARSSSFGPGSLTAPPPAAAPPPPPASAPPFPPYGGGAMVPSNSAGNASPYALSSSPSPYGAGADPFAMSSPQHQSPYGQPPPPQHQQQSLYGQPMQHSPYGQPAQTTPSTNPFG